MKKVVSALTVFCVLCVMLSGCFLGKKSDEDMIRGRVESFVTSFNAGDLEGIIECLDSRTRTQFKSVMGLTESIGGALFEGFTGVGLDISIADLFGVGMAFADDATLHLDEVTEITISGDNARADVVINGDKGHFTMVKEKGDWFIKDLGD